MFITHSFSFIQSRTTDHVARKKTSADERFYKNKKKTAGIPYYQIPVTCLDTPNKLLKHSLFEI